MPPRVQGRSGRLSPPLHRQHVGAAPSSAPACPRPTCLLRSGHLGEVELAAPLLALSADPDVEVAAQAVGTLANMAVDFSAVKEQLLRHEGVSRFAALSGSMHPALRLHGVWGLSSVAYMSSLEVGPTPAPAQSLLVTLSGVAGRRRAWAVQCSAKACCNLLTCA